MKPVKRTLFSLIIAITMACTIAAPAPSAWAASPAERDGVPSLNATREVLDSGLVLLHSRRSHLPIVVMRVLVRSGSIADPEGMGGLASITASLLSEGTRSRSSEQFSEEVEFIGASISASASKDYTLVNLTVLKKDLQTGLELLADALTHPAFSQRELDRKRQQITGSLLQQLENPDYIASRAFMNTLFGKGHPYGAEAIGTPESLNNISRKDIVAFHSRHYTPANAIIAVTGDLERAQLKRLITKHLGKWLAGSSGQIPAPQKTKLPAPADPGPKTVLNQMDISQANIYLGHLGLKRSDPDYYTVQVLNYALGGGGFSSRLMDKVRDDMGLAYSIYSTFSPYLHSGAFYVNVQTRNDTAVKVVETVRSIITQVRDNGITAAELNDAKAYLTGSFPRRLETISRTASLLALTELYGLGLDYPEKYLQAIRSMTLKEVNRAAKKYLRPEQAVLSVAGDIDKTTLAPIGN